MQRLSHQPELELLEVAQTAVEHLRRAARCARREIAGLDNGHLQPAGGGIERGTGAHHAAADDDDVELLGTQPIPRDGTLTRAKKCLPVARGGGSLDH